MKGKYTALDIANLYVGLVNSIPDDSIDNLKLNKMCYYAQGWSIARLGYPLFDDKIVAWKYGPVINDVYQAYKVCGSDPIKAPESKFDESRLTSDELSLLVDVYNTYGQYSSTGLMQKTHRIGTPWRNVYEESRNNEITQEAMREWFGKSDELEVFEPLITPETVVYYD